MVAAMPEDGGPDPEFSTDQAVQEAMSLGEDAYSRQDFVAARAAYLQALALDSTTYMAAVFAGDTYLRGGPVDCAYMWYERATRIDPDQATAWRYWSDILLKHEQFDASRDKVIEALVADPYSPMPRQMLVSWARTTKSPLTAPRVSLGTDSTTTPSPARMAYDSVRREWQRTDGALAAPFVTAFSTATTYRHSLSEEVAALRAAFRAGRDDAATRELGELDRKGLLEAYVFIFAADAGIAEDYPAYRAAH